MIHMEKLFGKFRNDISRFHNKVLTLNVYDGPLAVIPDFLLTKPPFRNKCPTLILDYT